MKETVADATALGQQYYTTYVIRRTTSSLERFLRRCFLRGGGSTESFFVPESLAVDEVIGTLR